MKHSKILGVFGLLLAVSVVLPLTVWAAGELLPRHVMPGGGGAMLTGDNLVLHGALGQPVAGPASNASYRLCSGFWCGGVPEIVVPDKYIVYLPLVIRNWPLLDHYLVDSPNECPALGVQFLPHKYYDDFTDPPSAGMERDYDWYSFVAREGATYAIQTSDLGPHADTIMYLDNDCSFVITDKTTFIADNDDRVSGDNSSYIEWTATAPGTYYIRLETRNPDPLPPTPVNNYTFTIEEIP